jgi:gliding motility-associated-like protein
VTGSWAANVVTISGTPTASGPFNYTVTLTGGCGTIAANGSITVSLNNTITLTSAPGTDNQTVCVGNAITTIRYVTTGATAANFTGLPAGMTVSWAANNVVISGSPTTSGIYNYTINLTGGCGIVSATGTITVMPVNKITLTSAAGTDNQTVCVNTPLINITYVTTVATGATFSGLPVGVTGTWAAGVVTINGTPTVTGSFPYTITLTGGCGVVTASGTITVKADNTITMTSAAGTDNQSLCINTPITNITYATTGATGATFAGLPAGVTGNWIPNVVTISGTPTASGPFNYTITLTGGCGTVTANGTITVTPDNTMNLTSAAGTNNQTLCINTPIINITYSTTGATGATITGLPAGVTGNWAANAVTISGTPTASGPFNYTVTLIGGCGNLTANGSITVTPDNTITLTSAAGTDNQTVCINTPLTSITYSTTGATGATITGLPAGVTGIWAANVVTISGTPTVSGPFSYTVTLTGGCGAITANGSINVSPDNTITLTSAAGTENQTICVNTPLTSITYGTTGATGAVISGLPAGVTGTWAADVVTISGTPTASGPFNYTITLTGGCGTITANGIITVTPDNTITLTSAAGTDNQTVCINTPMTSVIYGTTDATGAIITGLPAGVTGSWIANVVTISGTPTATGSFNYTVTLTGGCGTVIENGTITVTLGNAMNLTSAAGTDNQTLCINTPIIDITYSTTGATGATITGLPSGVTGNWSADVVTISGTPAASGPFNYTVTLTGGCGAITANGTITVTPDNTITLTSAPGTDMQKVCIGNAITTITYITTGAIGAGFTGLPAGMTVGWATNTVTVSGTPTTSGIYNYTINLIGGCGTITTGGMLTVNDVPSGSTTVTDVLCNGAATGAIDLSVTGGTLPYSFLWSNGAVTEDPANLAAGTYTVTITDANLCTGIASGTITEPATPLSGAITTQTNVTVHDGNDGSVTVDGSGGIPSYMYKLDTGVYQVSGTFGSLTAGTYTVTVQDANLCTFDVPVTITQPTLPLSGTITSQIDVLCFGDATGSVTVTGIEGLTPYEYSLDGGAYQSSGTFSTLVAGSYTVTVRDALLDTFDVPVTIAQPAAPLTVTTIQVDELCAGAGSGSATATGADGTAPYSYSWSTTPVQTGATATGLKAGNYTVTVTDANGCTANANVTITEPVAVTVITTQTNALCNGGATGTATAVPAGGTGSYAYSWNTSPVQTGVTATGLGAGSYIVTVTDANGCTGTGSVTITEPAPLALVATPFEAGCPDSNDGSITLEITGGTPLYAVIWNDGITTQNRTDVLPGTYSVVVMDANGCQASTNTVVSFTVSFGCLVIPDIITPDPADGHNDEWIIRNIDIYPDAEVRIFTRWGKMIFKTKNISANPWNGRYSNGRLVPTDSYHYILYLNDGSEPRSGVISVIR